MAYIAVSDFKGGLDRRKSILTAPPGTLQTGSNVHITRGGEVEKRKALVDLGGVTGLYGIHAVQGQLYAFTKDGIAGTMVLPGIFTIGLIDSAGRTPAKIVQSESYNGKVYAIIQFTNGSVDHFFGDPNGTGLTNVATWTTIANAAATANGAVQALCDLINADAAYVAFPAGKTVTIIAKVPGVPFSISKSTVNGGADATQDITLTTRQANVAAQAAVAAHCGFTVTGGTDGAANQVTSIKVGGLELLPTAVLYHSTNDQTAADIATYINSQITTPNYIATVSSTMVTIKPATASAAANGLALGVTLGGNVTISNQTNMAGGTDAIAAVSQVVTALLIGVFEAGDQYTLTIDSKLFSVIGNASAFGSTLRVLKDKMYSVSGSVLEFCAIKDPTDWTVGTGFGSINIANQDGGNENLTGLGIYQNALAIFARRSTQIWNVDPDPTKYVQGQVLPNIGTIAPRSVTSFGSTDTFFLSDTGIRSLRSRANINIASVTDVGTAIDPLVVADILKLTEGGARASVGAIEPIDGRFLLALGSTIYVLSYFPGSEISAWSTYSPGFTITDWAVAGKRLYARSGEHIYLYGGLDGSTYDSCPVDVVLPYLDTRAPASHKDETGADVGIEGEWDVYCGTDPAAPDTRDHVMTATRETFGLARVPLNGTGSHFGFRLTNQSPGYARLANLVLHYTTDEAA